MHVRTICLFLLFTGFLPSHAVNITLFKLSSPMEVNPPPPPICASHIDQSIESPVSVDLYFIDASKPIFEGWIIWKTEVMTECNVHFSNFDQKDVLHKRPLDSNMNEVLSSIKIQGNFGEIIDQTDEDPYDCSWPRTKTKVTSRIYTKRVHGFPGTHGGFSVENLRWSNTSHPKLFRHENKWLKIGEEYEEECNILKHSSDQGTMTKKNNGISIVTIPSKSLQFSIHLDKPLKFCQGKSPILYKSDLGFLITGNFSKEGRQSGGISLTSMYLHGTYFADDVEEAQLNYDLETIQLYVNRQLHDIRLKICSLRLELWKNNVKKDDADGMAYFMTGDPFSQGELRNGRLYIQVRIPWKNYTDVEHITYSQGSHLTLLDNGNWISVASISGIISPNRAPLKLAPPLLPTSQGKYWDVKRKVLRGSMNDTETYDLQISLLTAASHDRASYTEWESPVEESGDNEDDPESDSVITRKYSVLGVQLPMWVFCLLGLVIVVLIMKFLRRPPASPIRVNPQFDVHEFERIMGRAPF